MFCQSKSLLDNVAIASPCSAKWADMDGDEQRRHCGQCSLDVYNISEMTRKDAEAFLQASSGKRCLRLYRRNDGTIITKDCPIGRRIADGIRLRVRAVAASLIAFLNATAVFGAEEKLVLPDEFLKVEQPRDMNGGWSVEPALVDEKHYVDGRPERHQKTTPEPFSATKVKDAYAQAQKFETAGDRTSARASYEMAVDILRQEKSLHDPQFIKMVVKKYCNLLRKDKQEKLAKSLLREFAIDRH